MAREREKPELPELPEQAQNRVRAEGDNVARRDKHVTIGVHLGNPCMVPRSRPWKGMEDVQVHPEFASFKEAVWGYRAGLIHYIDNGVPEEVLTEAGLPPGTAIARGNVLDILRAATRLHNGREAWSRETARAGIRLAGL
jgi:hypothetical protein